MTNKYGIAAFNPRDLVKQTIYDVFVMWPEGYQKVAVPSTITYAGDTLIQFALGGKP